MDGLIFLGQIICHPKSVILLTNQEPIKYASKANQE
jgi:hypothetical protein